MSLVVPIDALAGATDEDPNGGNSTTGKSGTAVLSTQQAIDLKKAVAEAISNAFHVMASSQVDAGSFGSDEVRRSQTLLGVGDCIDVRCIGRCQLCQRRCFVLARGWSGDFHQRW